MARRERRGPRDLDRRHYDALNGRLQPRDMPDGTMSHSDLGRYAVTQDGWEVIKTTIFDSQAYPAAGANVIAFFQKGIAGGETASQTNVQQGGLLPKDQEFLIEEIEVAFWPTVPAVAAQNPAAYGAGAVAQLINDAYLFRRTGNLVLQIASKPYVFDGPLGKFPASQHFDIQGALADATTAGAAQQSRALIGDMKGKIYRIKPYALLLESMQSFQVNINYPEGVQALPSTNPANVIVSLGGLLFRHAQ